MKRLALIGTLWFGSFVLSHHLAAAVDTGHLFEKATEIMEENYVEPDRLNWVDMLSHGLGRIENAIPEVFVKKNDPNKLQLQVGQAQKNFPLPKTATTAEVSALMGNMLAFIGDNYRGDPSMKEVEYMAIDGAVSSRDPHSDFLAPRLYKEFKIGTKGNFGGLGIVIGIRDNNLIVISPLEGTPAAKAGVKNNDRIVSIDGRATEGLSLMEAVEQLRGKIGTEVTVGLQREGRAEALEVKMTRAKIFIRSIQSAWLDKCQGGYIRIKSFQEDTTHDFTKALAALRENHGKFKGLVLDLRNDPGGLLDEAVSIADTFLSEGTIVSTVGAHGQVFDRREAQASGTEPFYPIVVLVNQGSASASEIVAGALGHADRAVVVGEKTFGKGSVQSVYDMHDGSALKLTIAHYLIGGNLSIQNTGIVPDIHLVPREISPDGFDLLPNEAQRETDLEGHFVEEGTANAKAPPNSTYNVSYVSIHDKPSDIDASQYEESPDVSKDLPVTFACDLLGAATDLAGSQTDQSATLWGWKRPGLLKEAKPVVDMWEQQQEKALIVALKAKGINWSAPNGAKGQSVRDPVGPAGKATLSFDPPLPWKGGQDGVVQLAVTNSGIAPFTRLIGNSDSSFPLLKNREFVLGKIDPTQTRTASIKVKIPVGLAGREDFLTVQFHEAAGRVPPDVSTSVSMKGAPAVHFAYAYQIFEDGQFGSKGNGDGIVEKNEKIAVVTWVKNLGNAPVNKPTVRIDLPPDSRFNADTSLVKLKTIAAHQSVRTVFYLTSREALEGASAKLVLLATSEHQGSHDESVEIDLAGSPHPAVKNSTPLFLLPPEINLTNLSLASLVNGESITLNGTLSDEAGLNDLVIFAGTKKISYTPLLDQKHSNFSAKVTLDKGANAILLSARDRQGVTSRLQVMVTRTP